MRWSLAVLLLLISPAAHAMGTNVSVTLVAWNTDGSAALLARHTNNDGDTSDEYVIAGVDTATRAFVSVRLYGGNTGGSTQEIDRVSCLDAIQGLQTALSRRAFRDVWIHADRCRQRDRGGIVTAGAAANRRVSRSRVTLPATATAPARAKAVAALVKSSLPDLALPLPVEDGGPVLDAFAATDRMIILLFTDGGGSPEHTVAMLFVNANSTYQRLEDV